MITLQGYQNINEVLKYVNKPVYIKREDLILQDGEYLLEELIDCTIVLEKEKIGKIVEIVYNKANILLKVNSNLGKNFYIPYQKEFIEKVNIQKKQVIVQNIQGLII